MSATRDQGDTGPRRIGRALAAVSALALLVAVVPVVLVALTQALPLDVGALSPAAWGRADDGRLLLLAIVAVAWIAWAVMVISIGLETWAAVRRVPTPTLPGMGVPQRVAAVLVAAVVVALSPAASGPAVGAAVASTMSGASGVAVAVAAASAGADRIDIHEFRGQAPASRQGRQLLDQSTSKPAAPTVTTERHDTLWLLAEQYLGAGERYLEIVELNHGVGQPDGRSLGQDGRIYPGWTLSLPADAAVDAVRPERHRVVRGDTLWAIAGDELGDPTRYPEIAEANRGDLQPDGRHLTDPDLIVPGWVLEIPGVEAPAADAQAKGSQASASRDSTPPQASATDGESDPLAPIDRASSTAALGLPSLDRGAAPRASTGADGPGGGLQLDPESGPAASPTASATPGPASASPGAEPSTAAQPAAESEPIDDTASAGGTAITLPTGGAVAALLLAGVGAELVRRRRQFQRHRWPGERMPTSGPGAQDVEQAARTAEREPGLDLLDKALIQLAEEALANGKAVPDVRVVRVSPESVVLDLAGPTGGAIAPFVATDDTRWVLSPALLASELPDRPRALAGLVTLGFVETETVLLNLESVGTLAVTGSSEATDDVLRGLAAELAFGPCSALTERTLCVSDPMIAEAVEAGSIAVESDPVRASAALRAVMAGSTRPSDYVASSAGSAPAHGKSSSVDRFGVDPLDGDPLLIVLCDQELDVRVPPRSGCALITTAPVVGAGATLVIDPSGTAVLLPEREHLTAQFLSRTATRDIVEALSATDLPAAGFDSTDVPGVDIPCEKQPTGTDEPTVGQGGLWEPAQTSAEVIDLRDNSTLSGAGGDAPLSERQRLLPLGLNSVDPVFRPDSSAVPRVLLLGEVLVESAEGKCESTRIGRLAETAAFVLLNPGARPSELQGALWPGRRSNPQTCRQMISRARTWLGRTDAGEPYLMTFAESEGRLRLRPEVGSDWADFQRLAELGLSDPEDTANLTAALALVRGRPFGAVASRELPWADLHINEMISLIGDVAHALAVRHERAGRLSAARDAALRGLRTESESEVLEEIVARTVV